MIILIILLIVAAVALLLFGKQVPGGPIMGGVLVAAAVALGVMRLLSSPSEKMDASLDRVEFLSGQQLGERISQDRPEGGDLLVIRMPPIAKYDDPLTLARYQGLRKGLSGKFTVSQAGPNDLGKGSSDPDFLLFTAADWAKVVDGWCKEHPGGAVVCLLPDLPGPLGGTAAKNAWYGYVDSATFNSWREDMKSGKLKAALMFVTGPAVGQLPKGGIPDRKLFETFYRWLSPDAPEPSG